jgi:hypothetical protein
MRRAQRETTNGSGAVVVLTREELEARAEKVAQDLLHMSRVEAFRLLDRGKLRGTLAEAALTPIRDLLAD